MFSNNSILLLTVFGIPIRVHLTFVFLVLFVSVYAASTGQPALQALLLVGLVFASVVLHELGHALAARRFGIDTREIVLYPIGGVARLDGMPTGIGELVIAAAGPLVNLAIAAGGALTMVALGMPFQATAGDSSSAGLISWLVVANVGLFLFNLLPAFPMDGGRILRASLSFVVGQDRATKWAAMTGQVMAVMMAMFAIFGGATPVLLFIALFVFLGAGQEASFHRTQSMVRDRYAREAMMTRFEVLKPQDTLEWASRVLLATHQRDFPVVDVWGRAAGVLDRPSLLAGLSTLGRDGAVLNAMIREVAVVGPDAPLEEVTRLLQGRQVSVVLVVDDDALIGMITLEKLMQMIEVVKRL